MQIHGFNKTTLLDYPGHVAATIFTGNCNFRCPFCHNASLVLHPDSEPSYSSDEILAFLQKRKNVLSGLCITGGEPTLQSDLLDFIRKVKELGYLVKLDTNGYRPMVLRELLSLELIDMVAMDLKSSIEKYPVVAGVPSLDCSLIQKSVSLIMNSSIDYEFRTTVVKELHTPQDLVDLSYEIKGCKAYFLQPFQDSGDILKGSFSSYSFEELNDMLSLIQKNIPNAQIRGSV